MNEATLSTSMVEAIATAVAVQLAPENARKGVSLTFGQLFDRWLANYARPHFQPATTENYRRMSKTYFDRWKDLNIYEIKRVDVQAWTTELAATIGPTTANRCRELMRMVYNRGIEWDLIPDNYNPAMKIRKFALQPRDRFLQSDELSRFFSALETLRYQTTKDFLLMCLLTAARRSNVAAMRFDQICWKQKVWTIPRTKNGTSQIVPLTPLAIQILKLRKEKAQSVWVFPSDRSQSGHITRPENAWSQLVKRAGLQNIRIHDLRRSAASWQAVIGTDVLVIAKTLNHRDLNSTSIYARLNVSDQREAMNNATNAMLDAAGLPTWELSARPTAAKNMRLTPDDLIDEDKAAKILGVVTGTLRNWRSKNEGPPYYKTGISVHYQRGMLEAWKNGRV